MRARRWTDEDHSLLMELLKENPTALIEYAHLQWDLLRLKHIIHDPVILIDANSDQLADKTELLSMLDAKLETLKEYRARDKHPNHLYMPPMQLLEDVGELLRDSKEHHSRQCKIDRLRAMVNVLSFFDNVQHERDQVVRRLEQLDG